ncbi:MAG: hypothetical protein ACHQX3_04805, partial [Nitrospirales bacterium]
RFPRPYPPWPSSALVLNEIAKARRTSSFTSRSLNFLCPRRLSVTAILRYLVRYSFPYACALFSHIVYVHSVALRRR